VADNAAAKRAWHLFPGDVNDIVWIRYKRPLKKRCRIHHVGGLGVPPSFTTPLTCHCERSEAISGDTEDLILCHSELVSESQDCPGEQ